MPSTALIPWQRRWILKGTSYTHDYQGFASLTDYDWKSESYLTGYRLEDLFNTPCAVLLGEPALGKSTVTEHEANAIREGEENIIKAYVQLNKTSSEDRLISNIVKHRNFKDWLDSDKKLYLYLDGLDEALLNIKTAFETIVDWLNDNQDEYGLITNDQENLPGGELAKKKMYLRISCRSAVWKAGFEEKLKRVFINENFPDSTNDDKVLIYELAPLQREDVKIAAEIKGVDSEKFINKIAEARLTSFASDPISLNFLFKAYESGKLDKATHDKSNFFYQGLLHLCEEFNDTYQGEIKLSPEQRLEIASRIAAYTIFSNLPAVYKPIRNIGANENDLVVDHIVNDSFCIRSTNYESLTVLKIHEVLNTGLFSLGATENHLVWKHRTYAEFLAAWHLQNAEIPLEQILQLILSPADPTKITPQLQEVILWITVMNKPIFDKLKEGEPLFLLRSDRIFTEEDKVQLVEYILYLASKNQIIDAYHDQKFLYKLNNEKLVEQLRPFIADNGKEEIARRIAISIATECKVKGLEDELIKVVDDVDDTIYLRRDAIEAIGETGLENYILKISNYALDVIEEDKEDELKGISLKLLYPKHLTTEEVFLSLSTPKRKSFYGAYKSFIGSLGGLIPLADIEVAIKIIIQKDYFFQSYSSSSFNDLIKSIVNKGWLKIEQNGSFSSFIDLLVCLIEKDVTFDVSNNDKVRHEVVLQLLKLSESKIRYISVTLHRIGLIKCSDWNWLMSVIYDENNDFLIRANAADALKFILDRDSAEQIDFLLQLILKYDWVYDKYLAWVNPIHLDSEDAQEAKKHYSWSETSEIETEENDTDFLAVTLEELSNLEKGNLDGWWKALRCMQSDHLQDKCKSDFSFDITDLPVWELMNKKQQERVIDSAKKFLQNKCDITYNWFFTNQYQRPELAGLKAIVLLLKLNNDFINKQDVEFWIRWMPIILYCYFNEQENNIRATELVVKKVIAEHPNELNEAIIEYTKSAVANRANLYFVKNLESIVDISLAGALHQIAKEFDVYSDNRRYLLELVYKTNPQIAIDDINIELTNYQTENFDLDRFTESIIEAVNALEAGDNFNSIWEKIKNIVIKVEYIGKPLMESLISKIGYTNNNPFYSLNSKDKAGFLVWLYKHYPPKEDNRYDGTYSPRTRDYIADFRGQLLGNLIKEGTFEAVEGV